MKVSNGSSSWKLSMFLLGVSVITVLNCAGLAFLILQHDTLSAQQRELSTRLDEFSKSSVVEFLSQVTRDTAEEPEPLQSSRNKRSQELRETHIRAENEEMLMMMTYSMVPVKHFSTFQ